uniref:GCF C-terminal domain-containing protein n=2 Tax=Kalmanozyma brasiliensis (strain GHG001) TaxID=1365824 RepID=V5EWI9_KALBG
MALEDHGDGDLARSKFAADFAHDAIPSESVIRAAKEKRAKLRAAAANTTSSSEDFISLAPFSKSSALKKYDAMEIDDGPHPHSRLQREEDELGDGEDDFAEFTGATDRIPLGEKAEKEWIDRQRREMDAAVRGDFDEDAVVEDEMDEDEEEWERAQLRRTQNVTQTSQSREASPFRSAPIPAAVPLPSVGSCSTRLELTVRALDQSTAANAAVVESSTKELETIEAGEAENKVKVAQVEDKASWFNELDEFVGSLARFMEEKIGRLEEVEKQALDLLFKQNSMHSKRMGRWLDAKLEASLQIRLAKSAVLNLAEEEDDEIVPGTEEYGLLAPTEAPQLDRLDPADELSFTLAQREIASTRRSIFADVQAVEYVDPGALTGLAPYAFGHLYPERTSPKPTDYDPHPRSVVARFESWRSLYPEEYAQVWGGLSLAQIWQFYARHEMCLWVPFSQPTPSGEGMPWYEGAICLPEMEWYKGAFGYVKRAHADAQATVGGDDEVLTTIIANVLVGHLITLANRGAFSPWFAEHTREAVESVDWVVRALLGAEHVRYVSLVEAFLDVFGAQIGRLKEVMETGMHMKGGEEGARAAAEVVDALVQRLLKNLVAWSKPVGLNDGAASGQSTVLVKTVVGLVETLVFDVLEPFLAVTGQREVTLQARRQIFDVLPSEIVARSERLTLLSQSLN